MKIISYAQSLKNNPCDIVFPKFLYFYRIQTQSICYAIFQIRIEITFICTFWENEATTRETIEENWTHETSDFPETFKVLWLVNTSKIPMDLRNRVLPNFCIKCWNIIMAAWDISQILDEEVGMNHRIFHQFWAMTMTQNN